MTYDLHGSWDSIIGINAPLYEGISDTTPVQKELNVDACVRYWISQGAPSEKIILGMPLYGRSFTLANPIQTAPGSANYGPGLPGPYSNEPGNLGYNEICENSYKWTRIWDDSQKVPYAYSGNQWVGYDDIASLTIKSKYVNDMKLGGAMVWSIETDDFRGLCGGETFPLIRTLFRYIVDNNTSSAYTDQTSITSLTESTTENDNFECIENGTFCNPDNCNTFYICYNGYPFKYTCPGDLQFNINTKACDWKYNVNC